MPYKSVEQKKIYNKLYYERNKVRINALRVIKDLKSEKQRCIMKSTMLKYEESFDDNQLEFIDGLVKLCEHERHQLYVLPPPPPVLEVPEEPEDIIFIPRLPETQFFAENRDIKTFTIDEAFRVIHVNRRFENGGTEKTYNSKINAIMTKFGLSRESGLWSDIYHKSFDEIIDTLSVYKNPSGYIVVLLYIYERSEKLKAIVDKFDDTLYDKLQEEYRDSQGREKVVNRESKKNDKTNYIQHYHDLFAIEQELAKTQYASSKHIISLLYSRGLFDNEGNLLLIPRNYFWNIEFVESDDEIIEKPRHIGSGYNYYNYNTGKLYIQSYKTAGKYKAINIILNNYTRKVILKSYNNKKRKWLFTTTHGDTPYASNTSFGSQISETLGITINQFRRSFINYHHFVEEMARDKIAKVAGHSVDVNELIYSTIDSNEAIENTIYDKDVIGKKVNVIVKVRGKRTGKSYVGVVTRSLKPNRDRYPYSIVFDKKDNLTDEQATTIPDEADGITMYDEEQQEPEPNPTNTTNNKKNSNKQNSNKQTFNKQKKGTRRSNRNKKN